MNRSFCLAAVLLAEHPHIPIMVGSNFPILNHQKLMNFKEFRFKESPVYAELPIDENPVYNEPVAVKNAVFSKVPTEPLTGKLHLVCASEDCLTNILDLDPACSETEEFIDFIAGRYLPDGGLTVCHRYGGHQFGFWADQLGDGRAHILGEYVNRQVLHGSFVILKK
ncbi:protein adenylyltransferase SelO-like [Ostrinia nubilalis]|uniref:protein adenylyltransferase SelO-like n=1 Tax=Ostrinia nubilalis TaxID=29057 RepID=UPI0030822C2A